MELAGLSSTAYAKIVGRELRAWWLVVDALDGRVHDVLSLQ